MLKHEGYAVVFFIRSGDGKGQKLQIWKMNPKPGAPQMTEKEVEAEALAQVTHALNNLGTEEKKRIIKVNFCRESPHNFFTISQLYPPPSTKN